MRKTAFLIASALAFTTLASAAARTPEAITRAYIQDGLVSSSVGYELSTGLQHKEDIETETNGEEAHSYYVNTLSELGNEVVPKTTIERLQNFTERNETFKAANSKELNAAYAKITSGGSPERKKKRSFLLASISAFGLDAQSMTEMPPWKANALGVAGAAFMTAATEWIRKKAVAEMA